MNARSFHSPHDYTRFPENVQTNTRQQQQHQQPHHHHEKRRQQQYHHYHHENDYYQDFNYNQNPNVHNHRSNYSFVREPTHEYVPPPAPQQQSPPPPPPTQEYRSPLQENQRRNYNQQPYHHHSTPIHNSIEQDDRAFAAVGRRILVAIDNALHSASANNEKDHSLTKVLQLHKMMSIRELIEFNDVLQKRVRLSSLCPYENWTFVDGLANECNQCFGDELRMLISQKGSLSPFFHKQRSTMNHHHQHQQHQQQHHDPYQRMNQREGTGSPLRPHRFGGSGTENRNNYDAAGIDLTSHIIYDDSNVPSPMARESSHSFDYNDDKIYSNITAATAPSSDYESDKEVYTIDLDDNRAKDKRSPNNVRFDKHATSSSTANTSPHKKRIMKSPRIVGARESVEVVAPATLPENFMFEARMGDQVFMVVVPKGGVRKGQVFKSNKVDVDSVAVQEPSTRFKTKVDMKIPLGHWRHSLFDCVRYGFFHPLLMNSIFCPHVALAQIMARMKLNFQGNRTMEIRSRVQLAKVIFIPSVIVILNGLLGYLMFRGYYFHVKHVFKIFLYSSIIVLIVDAFIIAYFFALLIKTRKQVRYAFNIPRESPVEDMFVSIFCTPCTIIQMGLHTADYYTYVAHCCSDTGLSRHIELKDLDLEERCAIGDDRV